MKSYGQSAALCWFALILIQSPSAFGWQASTQTTPPPTTQTPPAPAQTPAAQPPAATAAESNSGDAKFSIELFGWMTDSELKIRTGQNNINTRSTNVDLERKKFLTPGAMLSLPMGKLNTLRISFFQTKRSGQTRATQDLTVFGNNFETGDNLITNYTLRNLKVSFDYLSSPFPVNNSKFRLKTLWEVQYVSFKSSVEKNETDDDGNVINTFGENSRWLLLPTVGLGFEAAPTKNFRFEAKASGFGFPGRSIIGDGEVAGAVRVSRAEIRFGGKAFYFRTSTKKEEFYRGIVYGPFVAFRWY